MRCNRRAWLLVGAMATGAAFAGCGETPVGLTQPSASATPTGFAPTPVGLETPAAGSIYLGAYVSPSPNGGVASLEKQIKRKVALDMHYYSWAGLFPSTNEDTDIANRRIPVESWDCGPSNAAVASGADDPLIQTRAQAIKNFGHPVFLRYMWDPNLPATALNRAQCFDPSTDNSDGTFSASEYVAAWEHIREIFKTEGVTNIVWVWDVAALGADPRAYYPGSTEVDWVGVDAYDTAGAGFTATLSPIYALVAPFAKPILVAETGETASDQQAFFTDAPPVLQDEFPMIDGLMYYDGSNAFGNWSLSPEGAAAFAGLAAAPYFSAYGSL
jgi:hypothetical protein